MHPALIIQFFLLTLFLSASGNATEYRTLEEVEIYVASNGDDGNDGSKGNPKRTLAAAIESVRGNGVPTTIWLAAQIHRIDQTIQLSKKDSRTKEAPLTIKSFASKKKKSAKLVSGIPIDPESWKKVSENDRLLDVLPKNSRKKVLVTDLSNSPAGSEFPYRPDSAKRDTHPFLSWNGYVLQQAQWPNVGYAFFDKTIVKGPTTRWLKATEKPAAWSFEDPSGGAWRYADSRLSE